MAFIRVEDRFGEIEVIVFARQYSKYLYDIELDRAVLISGTVSVEEGEEPKILLSALNLLTENQKFQARTETARKRIYIKVPDINDPKLQRIGKISLLNPGTCEVVIFDERTKKYSVYKDILISESENVLSRLYGIFGKENIVVK